MTDLPDVAELVELVERLDADNERLRMKALDLMRLMEEAVNEQVAGERRIAELEKQNAQLTAEVAALHGTKLLRAAAPFRRMYARARGLRARRG